MVLNLALFSVYELYLVEIPKDAASTLLKPLYALFHFLDVW